jgi:hypothetical protein
VKGVALALLASVLAGCSAIRLAYDNADLYLRWKIASYVEVEGAQSDELDERIDDFVAWHRTNALPKYARLAEEASRRMARGSLTAGDVLWAYESVVEQARESLSAGTERLAPILDNLNPEQLKHLERGIAEDNRRFARDNLRGSERERRERRAERLAERIEDWVGRLSPAQYERVRQFSLAAPLASEMRDRDRRRLQAEIVAIVRAREARRRLPERIAWWQKGRDPAFVATNEVFQQHMVALILDLDRSLSGEQRARAVSELRRYSKEFNLLAMRRTP